MVVEVVVIVGRQPSCCGGSTKCDLNPMASWAAGNCSVVGFLYVCCN